MLDSRGNPYLLEINTSPGMTTTAWCRWRRGAGMDFDALCLRILEMTL